MKPNNAQTLLVTGGAGYIGSHLVARAIDAGYTVHILDSADPEQDALRSLFSHASVRYFQGSITDRETLAESMAGVHAVVHLAGISDGRAGKENPELTRRVNTESMEGLLSVARSSGVHRFVFASTMGVYGNAYATPLHEELPLNPVDPYSESKAVGEEAVRAANTADFCTTSLRIAMVYGVGPKVREDFLVNKLCILAVREGKLSIMGGAQRRPQIHIDDLALLFLQLLQTESSTVCGGTFNAVESNPSLSEIVTLIREILPDMQLDVLPARANEDSFEMDNSLLHQQIGFQPRTDLRAGLQEIITHYQTAGAH